MASFEQCINDVTEAVGRPLTADEEKRVGKQFGTIVKKLRIEQHGASDVWHEASHLQRVLGIKRQDGIATHV